MARLPRAGNMIQPLVIKEGAELCGLQLKVNSEYVYDVFFIRTDYSSLNSITSCDILIPTPLPVFCP